MREIKFRGKRLDNNEFIYGYLVIDKDNANYIVNNYGDDSYSWDEINPETVGQYIGLKDKNGNEIYEGDIFKTISGVVAVVEWDENNARFLGFTLESERKIIYISREPEVEVIGNIRENQELLEVNK